MKYESRLPRLGKKAFLGAVLLASLAQAAPDCIIKIDGMALNAGPVSDAGHGYCVTQELALNEGGNGWLVHTTYESGEVVDYIIGATDKKNAWLGTQDEYVSYGQDAWPEDEYARHLPRPAIPAFMTGVAQGKGQKTGEWFFSAVFIDKEGKVQDGMRAYIGQLKTQGFAGNAHDEEIRNKDVALNGVLPPDAVALLAYAARNNAGFVVKVLCTGPQLCHLGLDNPRKAQREARERTERHAKEEQERKRKQKFTDDFFDFVDALPAN